MTVPEAESASGKELVTLSQAKIVKDWFTGQLDKKQSKIDAAAFETTVSQTYATKTNVDNALALKQDAATAFNGKYTSLTDVPIEFTPKHHTHEIADVTGLQTALDSKIKTVTIGKTTTGAPNTQASVVNSGTAKDVVLDFTIPRGADGSGSSYTLPVASASTLGGVKIGSGISVTSDGTISASGGDSNHAGAGPYSVAVGSNSTASGNSSTAVGDGAKATAGAATSFGHNATAIDAQATAVGGSASSSGNGATAIGYSANAQGLISVAIGYDAIGSAGDSVALGPHTRATELFSIAIGDGAEASGDSSVAIGSNSIASEQGVVSFGDGVPGENGLKRRLVNVTDPINAQDAATKAYVDAKTAPATSTSAGVVKPGAGINVSADGTIDVQALIDRIAALESKVAAGGSGGAGLITASSATANGKTVESYTVHKAS